MRSFLFLVLLAASPLVCRAQQTITTLPPIPLGPVSHKEYSRYLGSVLQDKMTLASSIPVQRSETSPPDSGARPTSHSVRNGFFIGAAIGIVTGAYASTYGESGCTEEPCHARAIENRGMALSAIAGGIVVGILGAGVGKLLSLR
jgi:hypothetical protein